MDTGEIRKKYKRLLFEIPKLECDIKVLAERGKDPAKLENIFEEKKEELAELSKVLHSIDKGTGLVLVVSAPSGAGKTTICKKLREVVPDIRFSVSFTTRSPRKGERHGEEYYFVSEDEFRHRIAQGEFIEWAENYGHLYGTSQFEIRRSLQDNFDVLLDVDPRGAKELKRNYPNGIFIFILPPSIDILKERLRGRGSEKSNVLKMRLDKAIDEICEAMWYEYAIINDTVEQSVDILRSIYIAEKNKRERLQERIKEVIQNRR